MDPSQFMRRQNSHRLGGLTLATDNKAFVGEVDMREAGALDSVEVLEMEDRPEVDH